MNTRSLSIYIFFVFNRQFSSMKKTMSWENFLKIKAVDAKLTETEREFFLLRFSEQNKNKNRQEWIDILEKTHFTEQNFKRNMTEIYKKFDNMYQNQIEESKKYMRLLNLLENDYNNCNSQNNEQKNINYTELKQFLVAGRWRDADKETARVMYEATNYPTSGELNVTDIQNFPEDVILEIDELWRKYSNNLFGFSIQSEIYINELNAQYDFDETIWKEFGIRIGWRDLIDWYPYDKLNYSPSNNRKGNLPRLVAWNDNDYTFFKNLFHSLLLRVHKLNNKR